MCWLALGAMGAAVRPTPGLLAASARLALDLTTNDYVYTMVVSLHGSCTMLKVLVRVVNLVGVQGTFLAKNIVIRAAQSPFRKTKRLRKYLEP